MLQNIIDTQKKWLCKFRNLLLELTATDLKPCLVATSKLKKYLHELGRTWSYETIFYYVPSLCMADLIARNVLPRVCMCVYAHSDICDQSADYSSFSYV